MAELPDVGAWRKGLTAFDIFQSRRGENSEAPWYQPVFDGLRDWFGTGFTNVTGHRFAGIETHAPTAAHRRKMKRGWRFCGVEQEAQ